MNDDRHLIIHYNNGAKLELSFGVQFRNSNAAVLEAMKKLLESDKLVVEADGKLIVIPWSSVRQLEVSPVPAALPFGAIKGARVLS